MLINAKLQWDVENENTEAEQAVAQEPDEETEEGDFTGVPKKSPSIMLKQNRKQRAKQKTAVGESKRYGT